MKLLCNQQENSALLPCMKWVDLNLLSSKLFPQKGSWVQKHLHLSSQTSNKQVENVQEWFQYGEPKIILMT